jgi:hypothetical protein
MRFHSLTLCAGALLLIAAQEQPESRDKAAKAFAPTESAPEPGAEAPDKSATDADAPTIPAENVAEPKSAPAVPRKGGRPTREFMVGVWTENLAKCASALEFKADGTLIGPFPRWELQDGVLTMAGSRQKIWLTLIDKDTMHSRRSETDPPRTLKRCPASSAEAPAAAPEH